MRPRRRRRVRVHFLDVGRKEYGDAVLCDLGGTTVLIDGAHPGDQVGSPGHPSIPDQLGSLLEQPRPPYTVDLLIVTHAHQDHIGCLPHLVEHGLLAARWALVADPRLGWGRREDDAAPAAVDSRVLHLASALREEILSERSDDADVAQFLVDAANLEQRYGRMLAALEIAGTEVVPYVGKRMSALEREFESVGLGVLGPSEAQLLLCARAITEATRDAVRAATDMLERDDTPNDPVGAYRRLVAPGIDSIDARKRPGPPINLQSAVTSFDVGGVKLLFAGDMQLADPQTGAAGLREEVRKLRTTLGAEAPFDLVKISHHGSDNALSEEILAELGTTALYGICAGEESTHHPNRRVLRLLDEQRDRLQWVRTDRNGLSTVELGGARPKLSVAQGEPSDATPNVLDEPLAAPAATTTPAAEPEIVRSERDDVEVIARIPHADTRVSVTVEVSPGARGADVRAPRRSASGAVGGGRDLSNLLFVTSRDALAANIGRAESERLLDQMERQGLLVFDDLPRDEPGPKRATALVREQLRRNRDVRGVVLLGGYDVVPARKLDCLPPRIREGMGASDDPDDFVVWNDDGYGDREGTWQPEVPVTRVPDGRSEDFLLAALETSEERRPAPRRGVRNVARPFAEPIFAELPGDEQLFSSAPTIFDQAPPVRLDADRVYLMLHGDFLDATRFWGEQTANEREAVNLTNIPSPCGRVVLTGCCWGALITDQPAVRAIPGEPPPPKPPGASIALTFLARGATAFVGCTGAHYSPTVEPFGYFGGPLHASFWRQLQTGSPPARALFEAKREFAAGMPHGRTTPAQQAIELKILHQFTCLGLGW